MQQNGQEQQERSRLQQAVEQPEREGEPNSAPISAQGEQQLPAEQLKTEECLDLLRRTQADFVNYRRRMSQEQAEGRIAAQGALLSRLLPVLDDLGRALGAVPPELATHPWVQGLLLVERRLTALRDQLGKGSLYSLPSTDVVYLAEEMVRRFAPIEQVRFCNSGTEATMNALRLARAHGSGQNRQSRGRLSWASRYRLDKYQALAGGRRPHRAPEQHPGFEGHSL